MSPRARLRKILVYAAYILLLTLVQTTWPDTLAIAGVRPDLTLVLVASIGFLFGETDGAATGLLCGLLLDIQAGRLIGLGMLLLMLSGLLPALVFHKSSTRPVLLAPIAVVMAVLLFHTTVYGVSWLYPSLPDLGRNPYELADVVGKRILPLLVLDGLLAIPMALALRYAGPYRRKQLEVIE